MNCRHFQDDLFEYVEGSLSADALAAAQKHLAECNACRQAVEKEKHLVSALSSRFRQASQPLALRPEIRRNILAASWPKGAAPIAAKSLIDLCKYCFRAAVIPAAMLLVAGILLAIYYSGQRNRQPVSIPVTLHLAAVTSTTGNNPQTSVSVQMSYRVPRHEFHQEEKVVVDAFVNETVVVDETIPSGNLKHLPPKLEFKTPL